MDGIGNSNEVNSTSNRSLGGKVALKTKLKLNLKKGALHQELGVKEGDKIPASKLAIDANDSPLEKKRKQFAINAKSFKH